LLANRKCEAHRLALRQRLFAGMAENEESEFRTTVICDAALDRFIADLGAHPLVEGELRRVAERVYVSLRQPPPEGLEYAFCLSSGGRMYFFLPGPIDDARAVDARLAARLSRIDAA
jgi:hypothetical protein